MLFSRRGHHYSSQRNEKLNEGGGQEVENGGEYEILKTVKNTVIKRAQKIINYPSLLPLLHRTPKNRICVLVLSHIQSFVFIPLVLSSLVTVTEYRLYTRHFLKNPFSDSWDLKT